MKLLNGILLVLLIMTSCSQELNHSEDWMNQVDLMISEYNENAKIELNIENKHPKFTGGNSNTLFKNNKEGLFKLKSRSDVINMVSEVEYYVKNDQILLFKQKGYLFTSKKTNKIDDEILLQERIIYFNGKDYGIEYIKSSKDFNLKNPNESFFRLNNLPFEEKNINNPKEQHDELFSYFLESKERLLE